MNERTLLRLFRRILSGTAVLAPVALGAGCGVDTSGFDAPKCASEGSLAVAPLMTARPVEYIELRRDFDFDDMPAVVAKSGTACQSATDRAMCESKLAAARSGTINGIYRKCVDACTRYYMVTTQGDTVELIDSPTLFKALLGTVDTSQEALLAGWFADYSVSCSEKDRGAVREVEGGYEVVATQGHGCGSGNDVKQFLLFVDRAGNVTVRSETVIKRGESGCAIGRRPAGLCTRGVRRRSRGSAVGRFFARAARLEAASVSAFRILRDELRAHGAPARLLTLAERAADDEIRHAVVTARIARRYGGRPAAARVSPRALRSLEALATENAVEGCVRETFGALVAGYQAARAQDPEIARSMTVIAADETRHAALAWQVHAWATRQLDEAGRARVLRAQQASVQTLRAELHLSPEAEVCRLAGMPDAQTALALVGETERLLWHAA